MSLVAKSEPKKTRRRTRRENRCQAKAHAGKVKEICKESKDLGVFVTQQVFFLLTDETWMSFIHAGNPMFGDHKKIGDVVFQF